MTADPFTVEPVTTEIELQVLARLAELYWHDISSYEVVPWRDSGHFGLREVRPDADNDKDAYLVHNEQEVAGFVVLRTTTTPE